MVRTRSPALVIQLGRLVQAIQAANAEAGRAAQAERNAQAAREMLAYVRNTPRPEHPDTGVPRAPVEAAAHPQDGRA
jgi:uncharacterized protein (DUF3084 family)